MPIRPHNFLGCAALLAWAAGSAFAQAPVLSIDAAHPSHAISPTLYGLMTEEINHSYDGGLYAELIQNRAFKDPAGGQEDPPSTNHWSMVQDAGGSGSMSLDQADPVSSALGESLKVDVTTASANQRVGVANDGFDGIPVRPGTNYTLNFYAKAAPGFTGPITADIESPDGSAVFARGTINKITGSWAKYTLTLTTAASSPISQNNRFVLSTGSTGTFWLSLVSLFPPTYANQPNGFRPDLMEKMLAMHPSFLRLPGGNFLEGNHLDERFKWKETLGDLTQRPGHPGCWGYRASDGMGLVEFMKWCEDLHVPPVFAVFAGYSLSGEHVSAGPDLEPYIQEDLDELQFMTGATTTKWGAMRAKLGHPKPFALQYIEIGNEDFADRSGSYDGRYAQIYKAIKPLYPNLTLIATAPVTSVKPDMIDEHYYLTAHQFMADANHYDTYDRSGPKIFVGEWASSDASNFWGGGTTTSDMYAAVSDSVWMMGMERNSDVVKIASYAPLFINVKPGMRQWQPDLIGYDGLNSYGSPSYYAQCMFGANKGDAVLPATLSGLDTQPLAPGGGIGFGTWNTDSQCKNILVTNGNQTLYKPDFTAANPKYTPDGGNWRIDNGTLEQTNGDGGTRAYLGDPSWSDYTLTLQARKVSGKEGFVVFFHVMDPDNLVCWNIGGWGDTQSGIEQFVQGKHIAPPVFTHLTVDTGNWHDIKIVVHGTHYQCYFDGQLSTEGDEAPVMPLQSIFAEASKDNATGDVIVKLCNAGSKSAVISINTAGDVVQSKASLAQLTGTSSVMNTIDAPAAIKPTTSIISSAGAKFSFTMPACSVNVLRLKTR